MPLEERTGSVVMQGGASFILDVKGSSSIGPDGTEGFAAEQKGRERCHAPSRCTWPSRTPGKSGSIRWADEREFCAHQVRGRGRPREPATGVRT